MPRKNIIPWTRFWRLVTSWNFKSENRWNHTRIIRECKCDCWNIVRVPTYRLLKEWWTKSCWCLQKDVMKKKQQTHWMGRTRIYRIYYGIKTRCNNPNDKVYNNYWARWIKCEWDSFEDFYRDMWPSYEEHVKQYWEENTTIERIDYNWNYCKENCIWATKKEQWNNQRTNTVCVINWEKHNLWEWSKILWIPRETLKRHILKWKIKWEMYTKWTWKIYDYNYTNI